MPRTTPIEGLPYPCLTGDIFERQHIEDLAIAADLTLNRIKSDIDLIDRRPRAQAQYVGSQSVTQNVFTFLPMNQVDYSIRMGAATGSPGFFAPDLPGLYYFALEMSWTNDTNITKVNPELVTCDSTGASVSSQFGRSFNHEQAQGVPIARFSGLAHLGNVAHQFRFRVRHQGTVAMDVGFALMTGQYMGGCRSQLLINPYFERGTTGWIADTASTTITQSAAQAFRGNYSLQVAGGAAVTNPAVRSTPRVGVVVGRVYHAITYLYTTVSESYTWSIRWYDAAGALLSSSSTASTASTANGWKRYAITGTAPASAATAEVLMRRDTATLPPPAYFIDDAELFQFC